MVKAEKRGFGNGLDKNMATELFFWEVNAVVFLIDNEFYSLSVIFAIQKRFMTVCNELRGRDILV